MMCPSARPALCEFDGTRERPIGAGGLRLTIEFKIMK